MIRIFYNLLLILFICTGCVASKDAQRNHIKQLQRGRIKDDSSFIYHLPYAVNSSKLVVQGYFSSFSHKNRAAIDFKMKRGTKIFAARSGVAVRVKEDGNKGRLNRKFKSFGNIIIIEHSDGSRAGYWHLQYNGAFVNIGDTIQQGQLIGLSGKTGYTLFPHLHFIVWRYANGNWQQLATRFKTAKGIVFLRPLRSYKRIE